MFKRPLQERIDTYLAFHPGAPTRILIHPDDRAEAMRLTHRSMIYESLPIEILWGRKTEHD